MKQETFLVYERSKKNGKLRLFVEEIKYLWYKKNKNIIYLSIIEYVLLFLYFLMLKQMVYSSFLIFFQLK